MPGRSNRVCPGCRQTVPPGPCQTCRGRHDAERPTAAKRGYDRKWRSTSRSFLADNPLCECDDCLKLPEEQRAVATDTDHVDGQGPLGPRGYDRDNWRPMAHGHHSRRTARDQSGWGQRRQVDITMVCGPPCSGKNTYVRERARPGDLIVDLDALKRALGCEAEHDIDAPALHPFALDARDAILAKLMSGRHDVTRAWVIATAPRRADRAALRAHGAHIVMLTADQVTLTDRIRAERPEAWRGFLQRWMDQADYADVDEIVDTS